MRRKVSTLMDEGLFRRAKLEAARQGKQISEIVGEALDLYLRERTGPAGGAGVVAESWAAIPAAPEAVRQVLEDEPDVLDA